MLANTPISFKVGLQGLTALSTIKRELVVAALTTKEAVFCSDTILDLSFDESFGSVPLYIENTSVLHVTGNRNSGPRAEHITLRYCFV